MIVKTEIYKRFDTSHHFWKRFDAQKPNRQKELGLYEIAHIDDPCYVTLAVNPKGYFEFLNLILQIKNTRGSKKVPREWILKIMLKGSSLLKILIVLNSQKMNIKMLADF